jgi:hypothetical protein
MRALLFATAAFVITLFVAIEREKMIDAAIQTTEGGIKIFDGIINPARGDEE